MEFCGISPKKGPKLFTCVRGSLSSGQEILRFKGTRKPVAFFTRGRH